MSVYVDDMEAPFGRLKMCHMIADTTEELLTMVDAIGVARKWIQQPGTGGEHFDICKSRRAKAVALGAKELTMLELGRMTFARRSRRIPEPTVCGWCSYEESDGSLIAQCAKCRAKDEARK